MPQDYQAIVLATYKKMRDAGELFPNLSNPTTAKLKKECLRVFDKRYTPEDDDILSTFFNTDKIGHDFRKIISKASAGTFRALWNHLKDDSIKTNERNSELLAWLIDFRPRPSFLFYKGLIGEDRLSTRNDQDSKNDTDEKLGLREEEYQEDSSSGLGKDDQVTNTNDKPQDETNEGELTSAEDAVTKNDKEVHKPIIVPRSPKFPPIIPKTILALSLFAVLSFGAYVYWEKESTEIYNPTETKEKCMHWIGNRYEPISCDAQTSKTPVIAINFQKLNHFKKINTSDKLTKYDLGKVWYAKIYGKVEFYTDSGMHPIDTNRVLRPLTSYMLSNYVSYHRYLVNCILWAIGIVIFSILLTVIIFRYLPKRNNKNDIQLLPSAILKRRGNSKIDLQ